MSGAYGIPQALPPSKMPFAAQAAGGWTYVSDRRPAVTERWIPPEDLDHEVLSLCRAMNAFPGIFTTESCCGHGRQPFRIWFMAESLEALPPLLYWFSACHTGQYGWSVTVRTDCSAVPLTFMAEGPRSFPGYKAADVIADYMLKAVAT